MATKKTTAKFGASVKVQRGYPGKIRSAKDQGYTPIGKREPARTKFDNGGALSDKAPKEAKMKFYSPDGNYKTVVKKNYGEPERAKETRTLKGVLRGVPKTSTPPAPVEDKPMFKAKKGGSTDKKWIQKAINPAHKGYCTPMTKPTCTPKRKALAKTLKKIAKNR
jgi:hypothetical protein